MTPISYPILPKYVDRLGGIVLSTPIQVGSFVTVQGTRYTVHHCKQVKMRLFVHTNIVKISCGDHSLCGTYRIKRFANLLGIVSQSALIHCFFQKALIIDSVAEVDYYFISFTEENIFVTWNQ
jgi:hypothetical protein